MSLGNLEGQPTREEKLTGFAFVFLVTASSLLIFLCSANWWDKWLSNPHHPYWLTNFSSWPWIRLPLLWTFVSLLYAWVIRKSDRATEYSVAYFAIWPGVAICSFPAQKLDSLEGDGGAVMTVLGVLFTVAVFLVVKAIRPRFA